MIESTELIVLTFTTEGRATEVLKAIQRLITEGRLSVLNMAVLVKHQDGKTSIKETQEVGAGRGAVFGAVVGGLIGLVGGPVGAVLGAAAGAATGGVAAYSIDLGFPAEYLAELKANLRPGSSAVVIFCRSEWSDRVITAVSQSEGRVIRHVVKEEIGAYLAAVGALDSDQTPATELPAKLEAQIAAWQGEIDGLTMKLATNGTADQVEGRNQLIRLRTMQRLAQEKLIQLYNTEVQAWTDKIEVLQAQAETAAPAARTKILADLEATRAERRMVRERLYHQVELRLKGWQVEIEGLRASIAAMSPPPSEIPAAAASHELGLKTYLSTINAPTLPSVEAEATARIAALQIQVDAAETELLRHQEEQLAVWQHTITDLQAYLTTPDVPDRAAVTARMAELQAQVNQAQARLNRQLETELTGWQAEVQALEQHVAAIEAASQARISERIAALQAEIESLQAEAEAAIAGDKARAKERMAALQAKITTAQARLQAQN
jgi:uncharacterized membrane protein/uncharacterized small protein (DUF1192 family)